MIRLLLPNTNFVGSFIATSPSISMQQLDFALHRYLVIITSSSKKGYKGFRINSIYNPTYLCRNIYDGGSINAGQDFFAIHTNDFIEDKTHKINAHVSYTSIPNKDYIESLETLPAKYLIVTGYMSWGKNQLEEEMLNGIWMGVQFDEHLLFNVPVVDKWNKAYDLSGIIPERIGIYDAEI